MYIQKEKEISMKGIWKKLHQKTAVMLVASMLATSVLPITGMAEVFDVNGIYDEDANYDLSGYKATASVAAMVVSEENEITLNSEGSGEIKVEVKYDVEVTATASNATASNTDWPADVKDKLNETILKHLSMEATVSNAHTDIVDWIKLSEVDAEDMVTVTVDIPSNQMQYYPEGSSYPMTIKLTPVLADGLENNIVIENLTSCKYDITVKVGGGEDSNLKPSAIELKNFQGESNDGKTWVYVGDEIDLNEYCETDPADLTVMFTSSNPDVASVSNAILYPKSVGTTTVTASVVEAGYESSTDKIEVDVWVGEPMEDMPEAFELYEGETQTLTFQKAVSPGATYVLNRTTGQRVDASVAEVDFSNGRKTVTVNAKLAGEYQLQCISHDENQLVTYYGYLDFTVKPRQKSEFSIRGFNNESANENGVTSTWTYVEFGERYLPGFCNVPVDTAIVTFTSSNETVATVENGYFVPVGSGKTIITATMTAPGYQTATATLDVEVWKFERQDSLPETITMYEGETWTHTFAEPLRENTKVFVSYWHTDPETSVGDDIVKASLSEDRMTLTVEAKQAGNYRLYYRCHNRNEFTTYYDEMADLTVWEEGVDLNVSVDQIVLEPNQSVTFDVEYSPEDAKLDFDYDRDVIKVTNENGTVTVTAVSVPDYGYAELGVILLDGKGEKVLAEKWIQVIIAEKQLEATTVEEALAEATDKIKEALENGNDAELYKIVNEVVEILAKAPQNELAANLAAINELEAALSDQFRVADDIHAEDVELEVSGALLNLLSKGERNGKMIVKPVEDPTNTSGITLDIKLQKGSDGKSITNLAVPMQLRIKVAGIDLTKNIRIKHTKEDGSVKWIYPTVDGAYIVFWVDSYSTFAISNYSSGSGGSGGGGGGSSSSKSATGTVSSDAKKGYVNSITGIITGTGAGYSNWAQDEMGWKLRYADGTFAAGVMLIDENGNPYEQVAWELINGAWYPFGADGYAKGGMVHDVALGGMFYVDINSGMKTGWQLIDGVWRYFNTESNGKRGIMLTDTTIDGYYIDAEGIWRAE